MDPLRAAFLHFYHLDQANAAIHMAEVRFSPVTFGLAERLTEILRTDPLSDLARAVGHVLGHVGDYELDGGR